MCTCQQVHNCHCVGCESHYKTNEHIEKSPTLCGDFCEEEGDKCQFSLFNSVTTKCYLYDQSQVSQIKIVPTGVNSEFDISCPPNMSLVSCRRKQVHLLHEVPPDPWSSRSSTSLALDGIPVGIPAEPVK